MYLLDGSTTLIGTIDHGEFRETDNSLMIGANYFKGRDNHGQRPMVLEQVGTIGKDSEATRVYNPDGISRTIKNGGGMGAKTGLYSVADQEMRIRRLTPTECERLQAFADGFTRFGIDEKGNKIEISDSQRYKVLGNAVSTVVPEEIVRRLYNL